MIELVASGLALSAEYLKTRQEKVERSEAEEFRTWLQSVAFPSLLEQSDQTLETLVSLKAENYERLNEIWSLLLEIRNSVVKPTSTDRWNEIQPIDRAILQLLYSRIADDPLLILEHIFLVDALKVSDAELLAASRFLEERELASVSEYSGGWNLSPLPKGVLLVWEATNPTSYSEAAARITSALPGRAGLKRIGGLARDAGVPFGLTYFLVTEWASAGLLQFDDNASPLEYGNVYGVSESSRGGQHRSQNSPIS